MLRCVSSERPEANEHLTLDQRISLMNHGSNLLKACIALLLTTSIVMAGAQNAPERSQKRKSADPPFSLKVTTTGMLTLSIKAADTPLARIAEELSKRLGAPVFVGPSLKERITNVQFEDLALEPSLNQLAPAVYIDYEVNSAPGAPPRPVGVYLYGYEDPPPGTNQVIKGNSEVLFIEGHTEDLGDAGAKEDESLRVAFENNNLTVRAKQQPISIVLHKIASELGIPFEMKEDGTELVDVNINKMPVEDAFQLISPNARLYMRADLQRLERRAFRIILVEGTGESLRSDRDANN